jgi:hypothetical protein
MRYLKTYESYSLDEKKERVYLVNQCGDIFYDLIHDGSSIDVIFPGKKTFSGEPADILRIIFNDRTPAGAYVPRTSFNPLKYIDAFYHLDSFLQSRGYKYFSDGSWYDTHEKLMKSFDIDVDLLLLQINYIKE